MVTFSIKIPAVCSTKASYVKVYIWDNLKELHKHTGYSYLTVNAASLYPYTDKNNESRKISVHFAINKLTHGFIVHELLHTTVSWFLRHKLSLDHLGHEENMCHVVESLTDQFYSKLKKHGLYDKVK